MNVAWISAGVSSFVAAYLARSYLHRAIYIDIEDHHPDSARFIRDCEPHIGKRIEWLKSPLGSVENALRSAAAIRFPNGAPCTNFLKKRVRKLWEQNNPVDLCYIWGFDKDEADRADRLLNSMPKFKHRFPLLEHGLTKADAHGISAKLGVKRPAMYDLGYNNNNCVGCVKGGMGYWNKIRVDFPEVFKRRAELERLVGASCLNGVFLDQLDPERGRQTPEILEDCGIACELGIKMEGLI